VSVKIGKIVHQPTGTEVELRLDKKKYIFEARYANANFSGSTKKEVQDAVFAAIEENIGLRFVPVIKVKVTVARDTFQNSDSRIFADGGIDAERYYVAGDKYVAWDRYTDNVVENAKRAHFWHGAVPGEMPTVRKGWGGREYEAFLLYSEETWAQLYAIVELMNVMMRAVEDAMPGRGDAPFDPSKYRSVMEEMLAVIA
jgi:hypothetical protein